MEFTNKLGVQKALKMHQSQIEGRHINVELTAGGGGKGEQRLQKVRERNKRLGTQRVYLDFDFSSQTWLNLT